METGKKYTKQCIVCGKTFETNKSIKITCCEKCSNRFHHQQRNRRYKGIIIDKDISLYRVAERDKQKCQLCGGLVDWNDKYINEDGYTVHGNNYPSIDHIKAISKGGLHEWKNVQLAHRICNSKKRI